MRTLEPCRSPAWDHVALCKLVPASLWSLALSVRPLLPASAAEHYCAAHPDPESVQLYDYTAELGMHVSQPGLPAPGAERLLQLPVAI